MKELTLASVILFFVFMLQGASAKAEQMTNLENVPYSAVLEVPFEPADHTLFYGDTSLQFGHLWLPKTATQAPTSGSALPLVIFIHGGCWLNTFSIDHSFAFTNALAKEGFAVWSVEYRRTGDEGGGWPGSFDDVQDAIKFILNHTEFEFNASQTILVGHSAGGHLALLAAQQESKNLRAVGLAAISHLADYAVGKNSCQTATPAFMGGMPDEIPDKYALADPKQKRNTSNIMLFHGDRDKIVPDSQSTGFGSQYVLIEGAGHFDWIHPQTKAYAELVRYLKQTIK